MNSAPRALPLFVSTRSNTRLLGALFVAMAAMSWIQAGYDLGEVRILGALQTGLELPDRERVARTEAGRMLGAVQLGCAVVVAAIFLPWVFHVRVNVRALGVRRLRFKREWSWLGFLVPGLNLWRPAQVLSEVWRGSDPDSEDPLAWQERPTPRLLWVWWILLLAWPALEITSLLLLEHAAALSRLQLGRVLSLAGNVCAAGSATAAYFLVNQVCRAQEAKWRRSGDSAAPAATLEAGLAAGWGDLQTR